MNTWTQLSDPETIDKTIAALKANNIDAVFVETGAEAKQKVLEMLPAGAEVFSMQSQTLKAIGLDTEIDESGNYTSVRKQLMALDRATQGKEMKKLGSAPDWAVGSVHAVTTNGHVMIASNTGSQLAANASGASHLIWVVGTQKIVKDREEGFRRIYEHSLVLESERVKKLYGWPGSEVKKILIIDKEIAPGRTTLIFVNEVLGF